MTDHEVVSVRDPKRMGGTEHSPVRGGGCSDERLLISIMLSVGMAEQTLHAYI